MSLVYCKQSLIQTNRQLSMDSFLLGSCICISCSMLHLGTIDLFDILLERFSGGLLIGRTIAVLLTMTLSTSLAAREGPVPMAGYEICLQVWLTISLLNDALALAGQVCRIAVVDLSSNLLPVYLLVRYP